MTSFTMNLRIFVCEKSEPSRETLCGLAQATRRSVLRELSETENGAPVRGNPKDSQLGKLRARESVRLQPFAWDSGPRWHEDRVPVGTRGLVLDGT